VRKVVTTLTLPYKPVNRNIGYVVGYVVKIACPECGEPQYVWAGTKHNCVYCGSSALGRGVTLAATSVRVTLNQLTGDVYPLAIRPVDETREHMSQGPYPSR